MPKPLPHSPPKTAAARPCKGLPRAGTARAGDHGGQGGFCASCGPAASGLHADAGWEGGGLRLWCGDTLRRLPLLPSASYDAVVTDPPYSSGGAFRSDRNQPTGTKYTLTGTERRFPDFAGDNRDQRGLLAWASLWLAECLRLTVPGGALLMFSDWRQLPLFTDAVQAAGWTWRGIVPWDKTEGTRPQKGWFRAQCEYVITATNGPMRRDMAADAPCLPGCHRQHVMAREKLHAAGKPLPLMRELLRVVPAGGRVLDPFAGSGTTLHAALENGLRADGLEMVPEIYISARDRLQTAVASVQEGGRAA